MLKILATHYKRKGHGGSTFHLTIPNSAVDTGGRTDALVSAWLGTGNGDLRSARMPRPDNPFGSVNHMRIPGIPGEFSLRLDNPTNWARRQWCAVVDRLYHAQCFGTLPQAVSVVCVRRAGEDTTLEYASSFVYAEAAACRIRGGVTVLEEVQARARTLWLRGNYRGREYLINTRTETDLEDLKNILILRMAPGAYTAP